MTITKGSGTPVPLEETMLELFSRVARRCRVWARRLIPSTTLKNSLEILAPINGPGVPIDVLEEGGVKPGLYLRQYWAKYYHDGHGPVRPLDKRKIVFFGDIRKDPRQGFGKRYPEQPEDRVRFGPAEFYKQLALNKRRSNPRNIMAVRNAAGASEGEHFFEKMAGVVEDIDEKANLIPVLDRHITVGLYAGSETLTVSL